MFLVIIAAFLFNQVLADQRCPFPSCSQYYDSYFGCEIYCHSKKFPDVGPINVNKIYKLFMFNLENIPRNAFQGLNINELKISSSNLIQVDDGAFHNVSRLDKLYLDKVRNFSTLFENKRIEALSNVTRSLYIDNAGLNNEKVTGILDKLKYGMQLRTLAINNNFFQHFSYDFTNFTSLNELDLSRNAIEIINIKSDHVYTLNLNGNAIRRLEKDMFFYLPNLRKLKLSSNRITKLYNDSFSSNIYINSIDLGYNMIHYIEPNTFCTFFNFFDLLTLSGNNLSATNLYCLERVSYLNLGNVQLEGEIDQKRIGNPKRVKGLNLEGNKISKINFDNMTELDILYLGSNELVDLTSETIQAFENLYYLYVEKNKFSEKSLENFHLLKNLKRLYLSNNLLTQIKSNHLMNNKLLNILDISENKIENVEFASLENLNQIYLRGNKLRIIEKQSFTKLTNLEHLNLGSNLIAKIRPKAFESNTRLSYLSFRNNHLTTTPDITQLKVLNFLDLSYNKISSLPNHAFERILDEANPLKSNIVINLQSNELERLSSKAFCSQHAGSLGYLGFELQIDDINQMDKCMLSQIKSDNTRIWSTQKPSCEHLLMAKRENIKLNGDVSLCQNVSIDLDTQCYSNSKFKCPKSEELVRYSTWITGDPHLYSYKNKYELCSTGQDAVCFQYGDFQLLCSDSHAGGSNQLATVLVKLKFIYRVSESASVTYTADGANFPNFFDNGQTTIYEDRKTKPDNKLVELINTEDGDKVIYIVDARTHIFISRWNSFYSITLRSTHQTFSESTGYLYEGCRLQDQPVPKTKREIVHEQNAACSNECSNIEFSSEDENMPEDIIRDACSFDCIQIGIESTEMIKSMIKKIDTLLLSDNYTDLKIPFASQDVSYMFTSDESTLYTDDYHIDDTSISSIFNSIIVFQTTQSLEQSTNESRVTRPTQEDLESTSLIDNMLTTSIKNDATTKTAKWDDDTTSVMDNLLTTSIKNDATTKTAKWDDDTTSVMDNLITIFTKEDLESTSLIDNLLTTSTRENLIITSTKNDATTSTTKWVDGTTSVMDNLVTTSTKESVVTTSSAFSERPHTDSSLTSSTLKSTDENKFSVSTKDYVALGIAAVIIILILIVIVMILKLKKKTRVSSRDDPEI